MIINKIIKRGVHKVAAELSPYECNAALIERLFRDIDNRTLPEIPCPTTEEVAEYKKGREHRLLDHSALAESVDMEKLRENQSVSVEDAIWVEKILAIYMKDLIPMPGLVHRQEDARKKLYQYRG